MFIKLFNNIIEKQRILSINDENVYMMEYHPTERPKAKLVIIPPDGEERYWSQRTLVNTARLLALNGYLVLRFDYRGQGESDGDYKNQGIDTRIEDLEKIIQHANSYDEINKIIILGLRLGGTLLIEYLNKKYIKCNYLILWEPILDIDKYLDSLLRVNTASQMVAYGRVIKDRQILIKDMLNGKNISINGYELTNKFYQEVLKLNPKEGMKKLKCKTLIISKQNIMRNGLETESLQKIYYPAFWREHKIYWERPISIVEEMVNYMK